MSRKSSLVRPAVVPPVVSQSLRSCLQARLAVSARPSAEAPGLVSTAAPRPFPRFNLPPLILPSHRVSAAFGGYTAAAGTLSALARGGAGES